MDDPLASVYALVERAYLRLQAGDVLVQCIEEGDPRPIERLVEELVLAGPISLSALREIIAEIQQHRNQIEEDYNQVLTELEHTLRSHGLKLQGLPSRNTLSDLEPRHFLALLQGQGMSCEQTEQACLVAFQDSRVLLRGLADHLQLLETIRGYLQDWLYSVMYQSARQELSEALIVTGKSRWLL